MFSVYNFSDPVEMLHGFINDRKISVRQWSKKMGFHSPKILNDILTRKVRLKSKYVDFVLKGLDLDRSEHMYFRGMVQFSNSRDENERKLNLMLLKELLPSHSKDVVRSEDHEIFSHWVYMVVLTLAGIKSFDLKSENVTAILKEEVPKERVDEAIQYLLAKGFLRQDGGRVVASQFAVTTKTDVKHPTVKKYYSQVFQLAAKAIETSPEERSIQCFAVRLKEADVPVVKEMIRQLRHKISSMASDEADLVHQVNLCSFPLTKKMEL